MDEQSIFLQALDQPSGESREAWLDEVCGAGSPLRKRIAALLRRHEQAGSFLDKPPAELDATIVQDVSGESLAASLEAGLAPAFAHDKAVVVGSPGHSVLKMLGQTIEVPRVALRESAAEGDEPIQRPNSPEIPKSDSDSRYRLDGEIARGGMGAIIKGRDTDLGRDLAIKVLLDSHKDKPEVIQRFVEEAQIGGQLQHPGIAPIYELGQFKDKRPFFAMKLVKGQTLSKLLADREDAADERGKFIGIFEQVCQTMAYAHSRGVIHRDLKPANIMVGAFGEVQVMDWGLAKVLSSGGVADEKKAHDKQQGQSIIQTMRSGGGSDAPGSFGTLGSQTQMGSVMGTPAYMPPEQALGEIDNMDERADVFGLGAILCEILTGQPPYVAEDGTLVFRMASRGKLEDAFSRLDACGADEDLIALTRHCLELEPVDRPRDAAVLAERVTEYLESVETRLREAEVERAAEAARADAQAAQAAAERQRADAEAAQAAAERQRAEAESAKAEAESARANEESKRRRTSLALAASVLLLISLGGGGWLYMERQESNRQTAEANAQRQHAVEMQTLAEQRDVQRQVAEKEKSIAKEKEREARDAQQNAEKIATMMIGYFESSDLMGFTGRSVASDPGGGHDAVSGILGHVKPLLLDDETFVGNPSFRAELLNSAGGSYLSLTDPDQAIELLEKALEVHAASESSDSLEQASILEKIGIAKWQQGDLEKSLDLVQQALEIRQRLVGDNEVETVNTKFYTGMILLDRNQEDEAETLLKEVREFRSLRFKSAQESGSELVGSEAERLLHVLLILVQGEKNVLESLKYIAEIQELLSYYPDQRFVQFGTHFFQAQISKRMKQLGVALENIIRAEEMAENLFGKQHIFYQITQREHAAILFRSGRFTDAELLNKRIIDGGGPNMRRILAATQRNIADCIFKGRATQSLSADDQQEYAAAIAEGEDWLRKASESELQKKKSFGKEPAAATHDLGERLLKKDPPDYQQASEYLRKALKRRRETLGYTSSRAASSLLLLWEAEMGLGHDAEVDRLVKEQRSATAEPIEWRSWKQSQLISTARFLASKEHDESAIFLIEQALIAGFKGVDRLPTTAEFRNLAEQAAFQDLIKRYSDKK